MALAFGGEGAKLRKRRAGGDDGLTEAELAVLELLVLNAIVHKTTRGDSARSSRLDLRHTDRVSPDCRLPGKLMRTDSSGAYPVHGLLVANTPMSLQLVMRIYGEHPKLLLQQHQEGPFLGDNPLYVLAANEREEELCTAIVRGSESKAPECGIAPIDVNGV
eukprot:7387536-Prymnesium_polylepis.1